MKTAIIDFVARHYNQLSLAAYLTFPFYFIINLIHLAYSIFCGLSPACVIWYAAACFFGVVLIGWGIPDVFRDSLNAECQKPTPRDFRLYFLYLVTVIGLTLIATFVPTMKGSYFQTSLIVTMNVCEIIYALAVGAIYISASFCEIGIARQSSAQS